MKLSSGAVLPVLPIAAESSSSGAILAAAITAVGALIVGIFNYRSTGRQVARQYKFEQRKELRKAVASHHGLLVEAAESFRSRSSLIYGCRDLPLDSDSDLGKYYVESTAMRLMHLAALAMRFERTAIYFDRRVANEEGVFLTYAKAIRWVICDPFLDREAANPNDDPTITSDWFYTDRLKDMSHRVFGPDGTVVGLEKFQKAGGSEARAFSPVVRFIEGLNTDGAAHRWDRFVALDLVTMAFLNRFGYPQDHSTPSDFMDVAEQIKQPRVYLNLHKWLTTLRLEQYREGRALGRALRACLEQSDMRNALRVPLRTRFGDDLVLAFMHRRTRLNGDTASLTGGTREHA